MHHLLVQPDPDDVIASTSDKSALGKRSSRGSGESSGDEATGSRDRCP
jgi:hypothetical protein